MLQLLLKDVTIGINQSFIMEPATVADDCDGNFESKNIMVYGNVTIVKQTGPKLVYSAGQQKALAIIVEKCPIAQRDKL